MCLAFFHKYYLSFRSRYADCHLLFTNSFRGDLEAFLMEFCPPIRLELPGSKQICFQTHTGFIRGIRFERKHQTLIWLKMANHFGFSGSADFNPFFLSNSANEHKIGIFMGSSNNPSKCWAVDNWVSICRMYLSKNEKLKLFLYGSPSDKALVENVLKRMPLRTDYRYGRQNFYSWVI